MNQSAYYHWTYRGTAIIRESPRDPSEWALFLELKNGETRLIQEGFTEPQAAATCANQKRFSSDGAKRLWGSCHVADSIERWSLLRPDPKPSPPEYNLN
jgi:hypothetical protein